MPSSGHSVGPQLPLGVKCNKGLQEGLFQMPPFEPEKIINLYELVGGA